MDKITYIPLSEIVPNQNNPRSEVDKNNLTELADSIKAVGIINPITVRKYDHDFYKYQIVAGERRFKAAEIAGLETIPAIVRDLTEDQMMEIIIIENLQRKEVHPLDEATGFMFLLNTGKYGTEAVGDRVGKPTSYVVKRLKLLNLIDQVKESFRKNEITIGHALEFARLNDKQQEKMVKWMSQMNHPTANDLKYAIQREYHLKIKNAVFDTEDDLLLEDLPSKNKYCGVLSCKMCVKRTGFNTNLFDDIEDDYCTDPECYDTKVKAHIEKTIHTYVEKEKPIIQYSHTETAEKPGTLTKKSDLVLIEKGVKKCDSAVSAIVTKVGPYNYGFKKQVGDVIKVCNDPKCKVHKRTKSSSSGSRNEAANDKMTEANQKKYAKARFEKDVSDLAENKAVILISKKLKYPLDDLILNNMIENVIDQWDVHEYLVECELIGLETANDFNLAKHISKQSNLDRMRLLAGYILWENQNLASKLYKKYRVDFAKLKKEARAELKKQEKEQGKAVDMEIPENDEDEDE